MTTLIYAGIDEAGYGPMLGPLCVAASVFAVTVDDEPERAPDLWERLDGAICRRPRDAQQRIAIDDSKTLKGARSSRAHPLRHLERGVLTFLDQFDHVTTDGDLFDRLGVAVPEVPWYASTTALPLGHDHGVLRLDAARLRRCLADADVQCLGLQAAAIDPGAFNDQLQRTGNKAKVNFTEILRLADRIRRAWPDAHPRIVIDRQGGRTHYREELAFAWPEAEITIVAETDAISRYRLVFAGGPVTITFAAGADARHLPVALASMTAKYVRELMMLRLNRHFCGHLPTLSPTAGYVEDGRRYLREIQPVIETQAIDLNLLIRNA